MIIWKSNTIKNGSSAARYLFNETNDSIYFKTLKEKCEIAFLDKKTGILYLNSRYKMKYNSVKAQIKHDYAPKSISEYVNMI